MLVYSYHLYCTSLLATIPFIRQLTCDIDQVWYADDAATSGSIKGLHQWWDRISVFDSGYGYFANVAKTRLVVKTHCFSKPNHCFQ